MSDTPIVSVANNTSSFKSAPNTGLQVFSCLIGLLGITVVSFVFARRTATEDFFSRAGWKRLTWSRVCVICTFLGSWAFLVAATVLISGAGLSLNHATCSLGIYSCIVLYVSTKLFIYAFLAEKVWIVWEPRLPGNALGHGQSSRWSSPLYRICVVGLSPFIVVVALLVVSRISEVRKDGVCVIGLKNYGSLSLLAYDLFVTLCLTVLFVYPLMRSDVLSPRLRRVASRTLRASLVALISSATNITVLTILHGKELGWVCLSSCGADVTINAIAIYWVTGGTSATPPPSQVPAAPPASPEEDSKFDRDAIRLRPYNSPTVTYSQVVRQWRADSDEPESSLSAGHNPGGLPLYTEPKSPPPTATGMLSKGVYAIHYSQNDTLSINCPPSSSRTPSHGPPPDPRSPGRESIWLSRFLHLPRKSKSMNECQPGKLPMNASDPSIDMDDDQMWAKTVMVGGQPSPTDRRIPTERNAPDKDIRSRSKRKKPPAEPRQQHSTVMSDIEFRPFDAVTEVDDDRELGRPASKLTRARSASNALR